MATLTQKKGPLSLTLRPWMPAAPRDKVYLNLPGGIVEANTVLWCEVIYSTNGAPLIYLRTFLQMSDWSFESQVEALVEGVTRCRWQSDCPQAELLLSRTGTDDERGPQFTARLSLGPGALVGAGKESEIVLQVDGISAQSLHRFGLDLELEVASVCNGRWPKPDLVPEAFINYPVASSLNLRAYTSIGSRYNHEYLEQPFFRRAFESWCAELPERAHVLDVGCGDGRPIAAALAERGIQVDGIDPSAKMVALAREHVPDACFRVGSATDHHPSEHYDGICAYFSLLHMDPIELRIALHRIVRALLPGGRLLIVSGLSDVFGRTSPFKPFMEEPAWEWDYSSQQIMNLLDQDNRLAVEERHTYYPALAKGDEDLPDPFTLRPDTDLPFASVYGEALVQVYTIVARRSLSQ